MGRAVIGRLLVDEEPGGSAPDRSWIAMARCTTEPQPEGFFFPERPNTRDSEKKQAHDTAANDSATGFCELCPVRYECLDYAVNHVDKGVRSSELFGVYWLSAQQRVALRRKTRKVKK